MEKFETVETNLQQSQQIIEKKLKQMKKKKITDLDYISFKDDAENELSQFNDLLDMFDYDLSEATDQQADRFLPVLERYQQFYSETMEKMMTIDENRKLAKANQKSGQHDTNARGSEEVNLVDWSKPQKTDLAKMDGQQLNVHVNKKLDDADEVLMEIQRDLAKSKNIGHEILEELRFQEEKLDAIKGDVDEIYSLSKRSAKLLKYFRKQIMTDKLICVMVILIIIAIIIIIGLKIAGYKSDKFDENVLPNADIAA